MKCWVVLQAIRELCKVVVKVGPQGVQVQADADARLAVMQPIFRSD